MEEAPMTLTRRHALAIAGTAAAQALAGSARGVGPAVEAIGFDAFTIFDPRSVVPVVEAHFPGRGAALAMAWRTRQFEYCWLRTLEGRYADFWQITGDALETTCEEAKLDLPPAARDALMEAYRRLTPWPDAAAALKTMKAAGIRLAYVSNMTAAMLEANSKAAGIADLFDGLLSTDLVKAYKPDPRAYRMAETHFRLPREKIVFAAFGAWDAAGAKSFGLRTFWVNRLGVPAERLGAKPDAIGATLTELATYVAA
jgi:2-haloacid dehalogenase